MAGFARAKRVTDPLHERVKARITGRGTASVKHSADNNVASPSLSDLLSSFLYDNAASSAPLLENDTDSVRDQSLMHPTDAIENIISPKLLNHEEDTFKRMLIVHVSKAVEIFSCLKSNKPSLRLNVMAMLRDLGYNASICKTNWQSSSAVLTAGNYEFLDVVRSDSGDQSTRYLIDLDFAGEFEIARPSRQYEIYLQSLPNIFIGRSDELKQIVKFITEAAKQSLKSKGLHLPPWRTNRYMQNKWFGPYCRTTALVPANTPAVFEPAREMFAVECRLVGFDGVRGGSTFIQAATRTR